MIIPISGNSDYTILTENDGQILRSVYVDSAVHRKFATNMRAILTCPICTTRNLFDLFPIIHDLFQDCKTILKHDNFPRILEAKRKNTFPDTLALIPSAIATIRYLQFGATARKLQNSGRKSQIPFYTARFCP